MKCPRLMAGMLGFLLLVSLTACAGRGNYGSLKFDKGLDDQFTSSLVLPEHNYYITGSASAPAAILAIHRDYALENGANLWVPVPDVSQAHMQRWIENLSSDANYWQEKPFLAYRILDPAGKPVGAWYSAQRNSPVEFLEGNRLKVFVPHLKASFGGEREKGSDKK